MCGYVFSWLVEKGAAKQPATKKRPRLVVVLSDDDEEGLDVVDDEEFYAERRGDVEGLCNINYYMFVIHTVHTYILTCNDVNCTRTEP